LSAQYQQKFCVQVFHLTHFAIAKEIAWASHISAVVRKLKNAVKMLPWWYIVPEIRKRTIAIAMGIVALNQRFADVQRRKFVVRASRRQYLLMRSKKFRMSLWSRRFRFWTRCFPSFAIGLVMIV